MVTAQRADATVVAPAIDRSEPERQSFEQIYADTFPSVWRTAHRLGVPDCLLEDLLQDVYLTVFRKLDQFEGRCSPKTWVLAITIRVVGNYRRVRRRKGAGHALTSRVGDPELLLDHTPDPHEQLVRAEATRVVHKLIEGMDERRAAIFTSVELGGGRVAEIARELGSNVNTMQARLRAARRDFERGLRFREARTRC